MARPKEQVVTQLENLIQKVKLQTLESSEVDCRVFEPQAAGQAYIIEVSKGRFIRRVAVENKVIQTLKVNVPDPNLMRELRTAFMTVKRLADRQK